MLSFNQLQEKKTKIKINPKKEDVMEGSCGSYSKGGEVKKNHGEDCDCQKCEKKRRKEDLGDEKTVSTEELAYDSQEEVSEEGNQEIAETETKTLLTFGQYEKTKTMDEEELKEFQLIKNLLGGGGSKVPNTATPSPSQRAVSGLQNQARQGNLMGSGMIANTAQKMMNRRDQQAAMMKQLLGRSKGGPVKKVKKEEVELVNEMPLPGAGKQGANVGSSSGGSPSVGGKPANASTAALALGRSKGGLVKKKKSYKESLEIFEKKKELSIDDQMRISREYNRKSPEEKKAANKKAMGDIKKVAPKKDTRTDAQKMTDATGPRPGSRYRGD